MSPREKTEASGLKQVLLEVGQLRKELAAVREELALLPKISARLDELTAPLGADPKSPTAPVLVQAKDLSGGSVYGLELDGQGEEFVWTYGGMPLKLRLPVSEAGAHRIVLRIGVNTLERGLHASIGGKKLEFTSRPTGDSVELTTVADIRETGLIEFKVEAERILVPSQVDPRSLDHRRLGFQFYSLQIERSIVGSG